MRTRRSRRETSRQNRELVLEAAREVFLRNGFEAATIEAIARQAGFTIGVIYSQFGSKADLFLALLEQRIDERAAVNLDVVSAAPSRHDAVAALTATGLGYSQAEPRWIPLIVEFRAIAARDPELNARYAQLHQRTIDRLESLVASLLTDAGTTSAPYAPRANAHLVIAIENGVALENAAIPGALDRDAVAGLVTTLIDPHARQELP